MARNDKTTHATPPEAVISIIGAGMTMTGDCETDGALRIEGTVKGDVRAGKSVVIGKEGLVDGNIFTQDAIISGRVLGSVHAQSRLELQPTGQISGEIQARRLQLEEGASVEGQVSVGEAPPVQRPESATPPQGGGRPENQPPPRPQA
jgi:cytoskeletal protein CcmA (bactofilin family)